MEEDDEIHSNGRISVTVAVSAAPDDDNNNNQTLTLALPIQSLPPQRNGGGGREDCWSEAATAVLIEAWGERYVELSRGNLKQKHWKEVADIVRGTEDYGKPPKTDIQCKNRIDTVKKKYKLERAKISAAGGDAASKWRFFDRIDHLIGPSAPKIATSATVPMGIPVGIRPISQYHPPQGLMVHNPQNPNSKQKMQFRRGIPPDSDSSRSLDHNSPDSTDSFPPEPYKRPRIQPNLNNPNSNSRAKKRDWGNSVRELTRAILKFGEVYEQAESAKVEQMVEMEKQRMKFVKEMELQRMQFFMKTQLEISQIKVGRRMKKNGNNNHHSNDNNNSDMSN